MDAKTASVFQRVFRSKSLNLPKLRFGKRNDKRVQSLEYTYLKDAQFRWQLPSEEEQDVLSDITLALPVDVAFLKSHIFVVADSEGHKLDVFDLSRNGEEQYCGSVGSGKIWPNSITKCYNDEGKVLVTDRRDRMVKVFDVERGELISAWGSPWSDEDIPYWPHGISMTSKKEVVVTETSKSTVHVYNKHGKLQHTFGQKGNLLEEFCLPFYCYVDQNDRILISDNLNYSVKMFTSKGRQVAFMGAGNHDNPDRKIDCPMGVCTDLDGNVLVCDSDRNRILEYNMCSAEYEKDIASRANGHQGFMNFTGNRRSADLTKPELTKEIVSRSNGCSSPCGVDVGPCGTMVYTECTRGTSSIKAYSLYSVDIQTIV